MSNQLFIDGDTIEAKGETFECTAVSYSEVDGEKQNFSYAFRLQSEVDAERQAEEKHQEELEAARLEQEGEK